MTQSQDRDKANKPTRRGGFQRWRRRVSIAILLLLLGSLLAYAVWSPGRTVRDGRHDRRRNGIWLSHGWLGGDEWFEKHNRESAPFRNPERIAELVDHLRANHIADLYPHLCPCRVDGRIAPWDDEQVARFLNAADGMRVMPWVGGVLDRDVQLESEPWRSRFIASVRDLLDAHPRLIGVHLNVEPLPTGTAGFLTLLDELRAALPPGRVLSVAAYPPPTRWHPHPEVHWDEPYFREVASRADQIVVMMYDTSLRYEKLYVQLMAAWTEEVLAWSGDTEVLLGVPAYDDPGVGYHSQKVENLENALAGIHAGLGRLPALPENFQGVAIYSNWETDKAEWKWWSSEFLAKD